MLSAAPRGNKTAGLSLVSVIAGLGTGFIVLVALRVTGLELLESALFGALCGFTLAAFIFRERTLITANELARQRHCGDLERYQKHLKFYYETAPVCLAYCDAGTLLVDKVSPGFRTLFRVPLDLDVKGRSIGDFIRVSASGMEGIVLGAQREGKYAKTHLLSVEDAKGRPFKVEVSANYYRTAHMVEFAFETPLSLPGDGSEDSFIALKDLDRFRNGLYQRESRILELKDEVNEILREQGKEPRYKYNKRSQDTTLFVKQPDQEEFD